MKTLWEVKFEMEHPKTKEELALVIYKLMRECGATIVDFKLLTVNGKPS
jgi:hypothetical protein